MSNGCGPAGSWLGSVLPQTYGAARLHVACDAHDVCYDTCNSSRSVCDAQFYAGMVRECAAAFPGPSKELDRRGCYNRASLYATAVSAGGESAYEAAQKNACECCRNEEALIYCNCNKRCYSDATACLDECEATLGCFTGICAPAEPGQCAP